MEMILLTILIFILGLSIGSFLNCLSYRLYKGESVWGRSFCPKCLSRIRWYDNIPLLSYCLLRGHCRDCKKAISWQYPVVELVAGLLFVVGFLAALQQEVMVHLPNIQYSIFNIQSISNIQYPISNLLTSKFLLLTFFHFFVISVMMVIFIIDYKWYLILDKVTMPAMAIAFLLNLGLGLDWINLLISGIIGGSFFALQYFVSRGKWIGGGDIRLGALMGLVLGWPMVMLAIFLAYIIGSAVGLSLLVLGKKKLGSKLPLGTFLAPATLIVLFWGQIIWDWYLNLIY